MRYGPKPAIRSSATEGRVLRQGEQGVVELEELQPTGIEFLADVRLGEHGPDPHYGFLLGSLVGDVLAVRGPVHFTARPT